MTNLASAASSPVALVTGAFGAVGSALVEAALARGYRVARVDLAAAVPAGAPRAHLDVCGVDLAEAASAETALGRVGEAFGRIDALFNVAGGFRWQTVESGDLASWGLLERMNLASTLHASRAALRWLRRHEAPGGSIVNVGAFSALHAAAGLGPYAAAKSAVHRLTEVLAAELLDDAITVNAVLPTIIDTPANRRAMPEADFARWVQPADLATVMLFLASPEARAVTGALVPVRGRAPV